MSQIIIIMQEEEKKLLLTVWQEQVDAPAKAFANKCCQFLKERYGAAPTEETFNIFFYPAISYLTHGKELRDVGETVDTAIMFYKSSVLGITGSAVRKKKTTILAKKR